MGNAFAIEVKNLGKTYSEGLLFRKRFTALRDVSLAVPAGGIFGLLGPNGAGKTTLVKILLGVISKTVGDATMLGMPAGSLAVRRSVGYLPEHLRMAGHLTPYSALEYFGSLAGMSAGHVRQHRDRLLEQVGLIDRRKDRIRKFSKGMLQRLGLAQALLSEPKLLFLDEPTDGLDPRARAEMREIIRQLGSQGVTIFLNSHLLQEVEMICSEVAILDHGQLRYCGPVADAGGIATANVTGFTIEVVVRAQGTLETEKLSKNVPITESRGDGTMVIRADLSDQSELDQMIDQLRRQKASIVQITRMKASLEDAFLAMVDKS